MFESAFPTRLLLRCPTCYGRVAINREEWSKAQTFCPLDGVPMVVILVVAGATDDRWFELFGAMTPRPSLDIRMPNAEPVVESNAGDLVAAV